MASPWLHLGIQTCIHSGHLNPLKTFFLRLHPFILRVCNCGSYVFTVFSVYAVLHSTMNTAMGEHSFALQCSMSLYSLRKQPFSLSALSQFFGIHNYIHLVDVVQRRQKLSQTYYSLCVIRWLYFSLPGQMIIMYSSLL